MPGVYPLSPLFSRADPPTYPSLCESVAMSNSMLLAIMGIGPMELLVVAGIMLLLFGHRLPSMMRSLGRGVVEFKKGVSGIEEDLNSVESDVKRKIDER